ncbi:hypothetical protein BU17DRAFT_81639 [Hysterangium stoloniferum]|nr:hypothetical protein BU17DRAFT_81639 [Hysterangium stoloniferum]
MLLGTLHREVLWPRVYAIARQYRTPAAFRPVPAPRGPIQTPQDFLTAIGRSCDTKLKVGDWETMWKMGGTGMKKEGVGIQDRRYILWAMEKFKAGHDLTEIAHPEKPKKKIRGWGPSVQFGKRIRSRRHR